MAVASWKGAIQFGPMLQFGVRSFAADKEQKVSFNQHHAECGGRIRQQPGACEGCGEIVTREDVVRGYNGVPGIDEEYLEKLELEKSALMELDGLVPAEQIEPRWFRRSYDIVPEKGAEKPYALFQRVLARSGRVAIGKVVMSGKEQMVVVRPREGVLAMELLWWPDELKSDASAREAIAGIELSDTEIAMGEQLASYMAADFEPSKYRNEYAETLGAYLEAFVAGNAPATIEHRALPSAAKSLEDALAASLASLGEKRDAKVAKTRKAKVA